MAAVHRVLREQLYLAVSKIQVIEARRGCIESAAFRPRAPHCRIQACFGFADLNGTRHPSSAFVKVGDGNAVELQKANSDSPFSPLHHETARHQLRPRCQALQAPFIVPRETPAARYPGDGPFHSPAETQNHALLTSAGLLMISRTYPSQRFPKLDASMVHRAPPSTQSFVTCCVFSGIGRIADVISRLDYLLLVALSVR